MTFLSPIKLRTGSGSARRVENFRHEVAVRAREFSGFGSGSGLREVSALPTLISMLTIASLLPKLLLGSLLKHYSPSLILGLLKVKLQIHFRFLHFSFLLPPQIFQSVNVTETQIILHRIFFFLYV